MSVQTLLDYGLLILTPLLYFITPNISVFGTTYSSPAVQHTPQPTAIDLQVQTTSYTDIITTNMAILLFVCIALLLVIYVAYVYLAVPLREFEPLWPNEWHVSSSDPHCWVTAAINAEAGLPTTATSEFLEEKLDVGVDAIFSKSGNPSKELEHIFLSTNLQLAPPISPPTVEDTIELESFLSRPPSPQLPPSPSAEGDLAFTYHKYYFETSQLATEKKVFDYSIRGSNDTLRCKL